MYSKKLPGKSKFHYQIAMNPFFAGLKLIEMSYIINQRFLSKIKDFKILLG